MNFWGCGSPSDNLEIIHKYLSCADTAKSRTDKEALVGPIVESSIYGFMCHYLDSLDLTEHGSTVTGSWLTEKGEDILFGLQTFGFEIDDWKIEGYYNE